MAWSRGCETVPASERRLISLTGSGVGKFLQGLVTSNVDKMLAAAATGGESVLWPTCFLNVKGRIITDALLWTKQEDSSSAPPPAAGEPPSHTVLIDVPSNSAEALIQHLNSYKLRKTRVDIVDVTGLDYAVHVIYGLNNGGRSVPMPPPEFGVVHWGVDPRGNLGLRVLTKADANIDKFVNIKAFPKAPGTYNVLRRLNGIAEGLELEGRTALEANMEIMGKTDARAAVAFDKGCYLGQELTARSFFKGVVRKRVMPALLMPGHDSATLPELWQIHKSAPKSSNSTMNVPKLGAPSAGAYMWMARNSFDGPEDGEGGESPLKVGDEIICKASGESVGEVIAGPSAEAGNVALIELRLEHVMGDVYDKSKIEVLIGKSGEGGSGLPFKCLPFAPRWWPELDKETGKEKKVEEEQEREGEEEGTGEKR